MRKNPLILLSLIALFCCCGKTGTERVQKMNAPEDLSEEMVEDESEEDAGE